ncbi:RND multidrug efflux transporter; Acriflavin resistance protein [Leucobacter sp. 7(1)]|uniref:efflux RND transporter permease subunit n=1 Tax=Leucobacter sp. 7(1) TaxID=1255613 RepID=UPI00097ECF21|nr:efflux RND transporter permease subunit [Leucobacter sp. 7(1)]SJN13022.1 RND multidrug efflux transporter; Acriflavin resistance protein [Leucobacter sp. 7(1)]
MHHLTALSLKNRALIALVTIVAAVFGLLGVGSLKQELMPSVQFPAIAVVTSYPGASPEVVNKEVSGPIETALRGVPQLESSNATSSTGASMVLAQFTYGVDIAATEQKVERAVSRISQLLPAAADTQVMSGSIDDFPVIQIAVTPAEGQTPEQAAEVVERIAIADLSDLDGVRDAQLSGARPDRITIVPNFEALGAQGLGAQSITDTLQQSGVLVAAGSITEGDQTLSVQAGSTVTSAEDIAALPLPVSAEQIMAQQEELARQQAPVRPGVQPEVQPAPVLTPITIGDVAEVRLEPGPVESISRVNGAPALTIAVTKTSAANTVEVSHAVQDQLAELEDQLGGVELSVVFDQAPYVEDSIETLTTEGLLGLLFAVLVILVFLMSVRATLVTAISIPTSVLLTFIGLNFADYTLNMLTLGALTISIGRVVDDSIVVVENIKRHLVSDTDRAATITMAVREVAGAITASTITTVAVFLPMAFVAGMVGELFRPFAFTVTIALVASLLVSLTIVPVLAYWFLKPEHARRRETAVGEAVAQPTRLQRWYHPVIDWTLRRPAVTLMIAALVFGGTIAASPLMKTNFMGADEQNSVGLVQTLTPGTSLDAQLAQAERVEGVLADLPEVETVQVTIGSSGGGMAAIFGGGGDGAVNYSLTTDPKVNQEQAQDAIRSAVNGLDNAGEFSLGQSGGGVTMSSAIEVVVSAPDQETLATASDAVLAELREQDGLKQVESDLALSRPYLAITVDRAAAAAAGLTEAGVAGQVAQQMQPNQIGQITLNSATTSVYLADTVAPTDQAGVAALPIQTAVGPQALSALATVAVADGPVTIRTEDTARVVTISALPEGDDLTAASAAVNRALDAVELPAGANASIGGVMSQQSEAFGQLGLALLAAILIVYVVMVATFRSLLQPLLLLISVPFAATGAILLLIVTGIPLGVASLIGVLMLIGIVVTNAIVLIDLVNQYRDRGEPLKQAVTHGSLQRLRPIVMTALATILALTPMALGITGKGGFISQPLAVVVIGGLLSSTVLTLVVLPTLYYAVERRRESRNGPRDPGTEREPKSPRGPLRRRGAGRAAATAGVASPDGLVLAGSGVAGTAALTNAGHADAADVVDAAHADIAGTNAPTLNVEPQPVSVAEPASEVEPSDEPASEAEPFAEPELVAEPLAEPELVAESVPAPVAAPVSAPVPIVLPEPPMVPPAPEAPEPVAVSLPETPAEVPGPNTQQMSLDLEDLGFVGADNPIEARLSGTVPVEAPVEDQPAEPEPSAPSVPEPEVTAAPIEAEAATMEADTTAFTPEVFDFTDEQPVEEQLDDTTQIDAVPAQMPDAPAPPVTGELNWEQLLWQATQEIDEEVAADSSATGESAAADPAKNEGGAHGVAPDDNER